MDERQLIKQFKELRQLKPSRDWVLLTKREILGKAKEKQSVSWLFTPIQRPALVLRPVMVVSVVLAGLFVYMYLNLNSGVPQLAQLPFISDIFEKKETETEMLMVSLGEIQANLEKINHSLNNLKKLKNPNQALALTEIVKITASQGEKIVKQIETKSSSKQVLATLVDNFKELGETSYSLQKELLEDYINDLKQRTLSEEDEERLQKVEEYYQEGNVEEAVMLLISIGRNNNEDNEI